ncbi:MAG TPA: hypothetical protein VFG43_08395 [Geminicoccaceae bacterium]|nr:hypothetical protein [Geminicoccaceae bacterium]
MPLHRRIGALGVCLAWLAVESWFAPGDLWFWLALGMTGYAVWDFFLSGKYPNAPTS